MGSPMGLFGLGGGGSSARAAAPGRPARARAASDAATRSRFMVDVLRESRVRDDDPNRASSPPIGIRAKQCQVRVSIGCADRESVVALTAAQGRRRGFGV